MDTLQLLKRVQILGPLLILLVGVTLYSFDIADKLILGIIAAAALLEYVVLGLFIRVWEKRNGE